MTAVGSQPLTAAELLAVSPVVPVVVVDDVEQAVPLARALARGGVGIIEITLRTAAGLGAIERVAAEVPEILTGAGTVTTPEEAEAVRRAGAQFIVTPGSPPRLLDAVLDTGIPVLAGSSTLTEMMVLPVGRGRSDARAAVLPHRWHLDGQRSRLPRAAERRLCRRVVADAEGCCGVRELGSRRGARARGRGPARLSSPAHRSGPARQCGPTPHARHPW
jgi:hypothetical protein